jgi:hypothetical protein
MRNFHLPMPEQTYADLRAEAARVRVPATTLAREAIDQWLAAQRRLTRHKEITAFAEDMAGTPLDLDSELEAAGIEHLLKTVKASR